MRFRGWEIAGLGVGGLELIVFADVLPFALHLYCIISSITSMNAVLHVLLFVVLVRICELYSGPHRDFVKPNKA